MVGRKGGISGKQKSALLKQKRSQVREAAAPPAASAGISAAANDDMHMQQQISRKGETNRLSTRFVREDDQSVAARKIRGNEPFGPPVDGPLVYSAATATASLGFPTRPAKHASNAAAQEALESAEFDAWLASVHDRHSLDSLSPFEHNLEVWRQLWRVLERADVVCIVADVRNPLLHVPSALYDYCATLPRAPRIVVVLSKVDLVDAAHLQRWEAFLSNRFPKAALAKFSKNGRPVGGSTGGGVASRRKALNTPLSAAERRAVREYVKGVAAVCGVELPEEDDGASGEGIPDQREVRADGAGALVRDDGSDDDHDDSDGATREEEDGEKSESVDGEQEADVELDSLLGALEAEALTEAGVQHDATATPDRPTEQETDIADSANEAEEDPAPVVPSSQAMLAANHASAPGQRGVTIGFVGHPNVGKTSLLNALVGRKVASVSRTPGHTKHLQTWELSPMITICDSPGLVFPVAGALVQGLDVSARSVYECCGLFPIAQVRESFSAIRLLHSAVDLVHAYNLRAKLDEDGEDAETLSPLGFCVALAERKGFRLSRGRGAADPHRAGLEVLKDCVDGAVCLAFSPPETG